MTEQPDVDDCHDSIVVEGDDADHVLPPQELDPFTLLAVVLIDAVAH